jgi:hypothetical protein
MRIYFSASIHGLDQNRQRYEQIARLVEKAGHKINTDDVLGLTHQELSNFNEDDHLRFYKKVMNGMKRADALFAELSYTSTSAGFMIAQAMMMNKPVVIFYSGEEEPHLFRTQEKVNDRFMVVRYQRLDDLDKIVASALQFISDTQDIRFNFFLGAKHANYLNWIANTKKLPRSVHIRKLIDEHRLNQSDQQ